MDYTQNYRITEITSNFRGFITKFLAEAFLEEDHLDPLPEDQEASCLAAKKSFIRQYTKPFP